MTEIRTIETHEVDTFLRLLCSVFDLEFDRAESVFKREPFFDLKRKWAVFVDGSMASCLTTVPLAFGSSCGVGIAGVATLPEFRGQNLAANLIGRVTEEEECSFLFATDSRLYERLGFEVLDEVISCPILPEATSEATAPVSSAVVRRLYDEWALQHPARLIRDEKRWEYWSFSLKSPVALGEGYAAFESGRVREVLPSFSPGIWPRGMEWVGLRSMSLHLGIPCEGAPTTMKLMGKGADFVPQMFLTDQF